VIASNLPETCKIINENGFGVIIESVTPENISLALSELKADPDRLTELRRNAIATSSRFNWEIESKKVIEFYNKVLICE
jgi:glycosyltransferase involved in cell wall biosynthesis